MCLKRNSLKSINTILISTFVFYYVKYEGDLNNYIWFTNPEILLTESENPKLRPFVETGYTEMSTFIFGKITWQGVFEAHERFT